MGVSMAVIREVLLGIAIGYTAKLTFVAIQFAGQLVGHGMGFSMMRILDPTARGSVTITAQLNMVPIPGHAGVKLYLAYAVSGPWDFVSNPIVVETVD